jgi:membrane protease YdiL (CAAX protease family)
MTENPLAIIIGLIAAAYFFKLWLGDFAMNRAGQPNPNGFPGATPTTGIAVVIAVAGALIILAGETAGEYALDLVGEQSDLTVMFAVFTLAAAFIEELIFRGYLVVPNKGRLALIGSIVLFSTLFALIHPFLWSWENEGLVFSFTEKAWFSTAIVFLNSLWFYTVRFLPANPRRSLIPCILAHFCSNLGVILVKSYQGHVVGWF